MELRSPAWQYAAVGVLAAVVLQVVGHGPRSRTLAWARLALAGAAGTLYACLVPPRQWGAESGAAFVQTPVMTHLHTRLVATGPLQLTAWGALTGWALRWLAEI